MRNLRHPGPTALRRRLVALSCALLLALTGCGGGGGGGDAGTPPGGSSQGSLVITSANAKPLAADALDSATNVEAARTSSSFVLAKQVAPTVATTSFALRLAQAAATLAGKGGAASGYVLSAAVNETVPCSMGGSVTVSGNVASRSGFSAGDAFSLGASGCREVIDGVTTTMSGSISMTITAGASSSGAAFPHHIAMTFQANGFSVAAGGDTVTTSGDMSLDVTENSDGSFDASSTATVAELRGLL